MRLIKTLVGFVWVILLPLVPTIVISNYLSSPNWSSILLGMKLPTGTVDTITVNGPYAVYIAFVIVAINVYLNLSKIQNDVSQIVRYRQEDAQKIIGTWKYHEKIQQVINTQLVTEDFHGSFELWFDRDGKLKAKGQANDTNQQLAYRWDTG